MARASFVAIDTLSQNPARCPVIAEAAEFGFSARHLLYGNGRGAYRIIFDIREAERHVRAPRIWHSSRDAITAADVQD
jgi:hypothetical protein